MLSKNHPYAKRAFAQQVSLDRLGFDTLQVGLMPEPREYTTVEEPHYLEQVN